MKHNIRSIALLAMALLCATTKAQNLNSAYFTESYLFRHEMNPAMDNGDTQYYSIPFLGNANYSLRGNFGYKSIIHKNPNNVGEKTLTTFLNPHLSDTEALSGFNKEGNHLIADIKETVFSTGWKAFGGYNTASLNLCADIGVSMPFELFEFARKTGNKRYDIGNVEAQAQSYAEISLGHSRNITKQLRVGVALNLLIGIERADFKFQNITAELSNSNSWRISGEANVDVSMKGFNYKTIPAEHKVGNVEIYDKVNSVNVNGVGFGGFGASLNLGALYKINKQLTASAAVLDLGFISWSNDMHASNHKKSFEFNGFRDFEVDHKNNNCIDDQGKYYIDQIADFTNLEVDGDRGGRTASIGATVNAGLEYSIPVKYKKLSLGLLGTSCLRGEHSWTEARLSANYKHNSSLDASFSFALNSYDKSFGWILNYHPYHFDIYVGMDYLMGRFTKQHIPIGSKSSFTIGMSYTI